MNTKFKPAHLAVMIALSLTIGGCNDDDKSPQTSEQQNNEQRPASGFTPRYAKMDCSKLTGINDTEVLQGLIAFPEPECGYVTVPADWKNPDGATMKLAVYKLPATTDKPAADPVVYLEGGPGGAGVSTVSEFATSGDAGYLRQRGDVYVIDQRGTGFSQPSTYCKESFAAASNGTDPGAASQQCHDRLITEAPQVRLADYNSHNNALDVGAVRKALGIAQWNLYGLSYGSRLALTVMRDDPEGVRSVILDGVFPPQINGLSEADYVAYSAIERIVSYCNDDPACKAAAGSDPKALIEAGIERLNANPVGELTAVTYIQVLMESMAEKDLMGLIFTVAQGSDAEVDALFKQLSQDQEEEQADLSKLPAALYPFVADVAEGMANAVVCAEEYPFPDKTAGPDLAADFSETTQRVIQRYETTGNTENYNCTIWNVPAAPAVETQAVRSDIPTLILNGGVDVATPPAWGKLAAETLPHSQYAEFPGLGHGVLGKNDCVNGITAAFIDEPEATVDMTCIASMPKVTYAVE